MQGASINTHSIQNSENLKYFVGVWCLSRVSSILTATVHYLDVSSSGNYKLKYCWLKSCLRAHQWLKSCLRELFRSLHVEGLYLLFYLHTIGICTVFVFVFVFVFLICILNCISCCSHLLKALPKLNPFGLVLAHVEIIHFLSYLLKEFFHNSII